MTPEDARHHARALSLAMDRLEEIPDMRGLPFLMSCLVLGYQALARELDKEEYDRDGSKSKMTGCDHYMLGQEDPPHGPIICRKCNKRMSRKADIGR